MKNSRHLENLPLVSHDPYGLAETYTHSRAPKAGMPQCKDMLWGVFVCVSIYFYICLVHHDNTLKTEQGGAIASTDITGRTITPPFTCCEDFVEVLFDAQNTM